MPVTPPTNVPVIVPPFVISLLPRLISPCIVPPANGSLVASVAESEAHSSVVAVEPLLST